MPSPAELTALLHQHLDDHGTTPDGRLFRGGPLSESLYGRRWAVARAAVWSPEEGGFSAPRRPYDLRHAAVSTWLDGGVRRSRWPRVEEAVRAGS